MNNEISPNKKARLKRKRRTDASPLPAKAMKNLEDFWFRFHQAKACERSEIMAGFHRARAALEASSVGIAYVVDRLAQLEKVCRSMLDSANCFDFDEACVLVSGSVEVKLIRLELRCRGLISHRKL